MMWGAVATFTAETCLELKEEDQGVQFHPVTQGSMLKAARLGRMLFTETLHPANTRLPVHAHENAAITFLLAGAFTESFGGSDYECEPLAVLFKPAGAEHTNTYHKLGARSLIIELEPEHAAELSPFADFDTYASHVSKGTPALLALRVYEAFKTVDSSAALTTQELVLELLRGAAQRLGPTDRAAPPPWLRDVRELIEAGFDGDLSLSTLAVDAGVHPIYLARVFRLHYGCSIGDYVRCCRIDQAADQLAGTDMPASQLALRLGFYDQSHFTHAFKAETRMTPVDFRRRARRIATAV